MSGRTRRKKVTTVGGLSTLLLASDFASVMDSLASSGVTDKIVVLGADSLGNIHVAAGPGVSRLEVMGMLSLASGEWE